MICQHVYRICICSLNTRRCSSPSCVCVKKTMCLRCFFAVFSFFVLDAKKFNRFYGSLAFHVLIFLFFRSANIKIQKKWWRSSSATCPTETWWPTTTFGRSLRSTEPCPSARSSGTMGEFVGNSWQRSILVFFLRNLDPRPLVQCLSALSVSDALKYGRRYGTVCQENQYLLPMLLLWIRIRIHFGNLLG